jgi:hypothetical protein
MGGITVHPNAITEVLNRPLSQDLLARDVTRLADVATDGIPRTIPITFTWNGAEIVSARRACAATGLTRR